MLSGMQRSRSILFYKDEILPLCSGQDDDNNNIIKK